MQISLNGTHYPVAAVTVRLEANAGPSLFLSFGQHQPAAADQMQIAARRTRGVLTAEGLNVPLNAFGFEGAEIRRRDGAPVTRLVATPLPDDLLSWFTHRETANDKTWLIYQRRAPDPDGWNFFRRVLGGVMAPPAFQSLFEEFLPDGACLFRPSLLDNYRYLNQLVAWISSRIPIVRGWRAVAETLDADPLRLVAVDPENATLLNTDYWRIKSGFLPFRLGGAAWSDGAAVLEKPLGFPCKDPAAFLMGLIKGYPPDQVAVHVEAANAGLPLAPGAVKMHEEVFFCRAVNYTFEDGQPETERRIKAELELTVSDRETGVVVPSPRELRGTFDAWEAADKNPAQNRITLSSKDQPWILMDHQHPPRPAGDALLHAYLSSASSGRAGQDKKTRAGIYVRYEKDKDELLLTVSAGETPSAIGQRQRFHAELEKADLTLNAHTVAISYSGVDVQPQKSDGLLADAAENIVQLQTTNTQNRLVLEGTTSVVQILKTVKIHEQLEVGQ